MDSKVASIHIWQAIHLMRELTAKGETFSFSFATYNRQTGRCHGMTSVKRAYLRPAAKGDDITHADHKLFYFDDVDQKPKVCWQPLIMYFNGFKIAL
jgi:hypothetical protein